MSCSSFMGLPKSRNIGIKAVHLNWICFSIVVDRTCL